MASKGGHCRGNEAKTWVLQAGHCRVLKAGCWVKKANANATGKNFVENKKFGRF